MTDEELKKQAEHIKKADETLSKVNDKLGEIEKSLDGKVDDAKFNEIQKGLNDLKDVVAGIDMIGDKKLSDYVTTQQDHINKLETEISDLKASGASRQDVYEKELHDLATNKEFITALKNNAVKEFMIKASSVLTSSFTAATGTVALDQYSIPGITKHPWRANPIYSAINKQFVGEKVNSIIWYEENSRTDGADWKGENEAYGQSDAAWKRQVEYFHKIGHYVQLSEESLEDADYVMGELNDLLTNGLMRQVEIDLLDGTGHDNDEILGLINTTSQIAKDWSIPSGVSPIPKANIYDAFRYMAVQVKLGYTTDTNKQGYQPNIVVVNPVTAEGMRDIKDDNGNYIIPPAMVGDVRVRGMLIVESFDIDAGKALVGDFTKMKAYIKRNLNLKTSENVASTFLSDIQTVKANMRIATKVTNIEKYAFVYGDIDEAIEDLIAGNI